MFDFKRIIGAWRAEGLISRMYDEFEEILETAAAMLVKVRSTLRGEFRAADTWDEIRAQDKQINRIQRLIRRQLVEHLSVAAGVDIPACLILMSTVKDAERLGDYAGYLFKIAYICPDPLKTDGFAEEMERLWSEVDSMMAEGRRALQDSDEPLARAVMEKENLVKKGCDAMLEKIAKGGVPPERIVAVTLISRYLRRLGGHTANIASSVVNPVERLDYKPKD